MENKNPKFGGEDLAALRRDLVKFAALQLRNQEMAEDAVHEAWASALTAQDRFENRSSFRTWIFSILKNKIVDLMRDRWNRLRVHPEVFETTDDDFDPLFRENGHWNKQDRPSDWGDPGLHLENQEFWRILQTCVEQLPETTARVFAMREILGMEVEEICKELTITSSNCYVMLHRARMTLRLCLQARWFQGDK